ncbi:tape measure protein [Weissella ceti]|uniref:Tape measure protein n=1 Tax=Weissella ceti TaxID=759620 RepID=A0ABT3E498_9LACO|nr:tape measure protein [Weissella ceti]MCW0953185.1 tape measure protein [Weissella ceti]QVK12703.1 tape measure protein [Weissella ceti]
MATISSTLQINDRFTGPLKSMFSSMNMVKKSTQGLNTAMNQNNKMGSEMQRAEKMALLAGRAFKEAKSNAEALGKAGTASASDMLKAEKNVEKMRGEFKASKQAVESLKSSMGSMPSEGVKKATQDVQQLGEQAQKSGSMFKAVLGGSLVGGAISKGMGVVSNSVDGAIGRIDTLSNSGKVFGNLGVSANQAKVGMANLDTAIDGLPTALDTAVQGVQTFVSANGDMNKSVKLYKSINDTILGFGGTTEQSASAVMQLGKAFGKGKIQGEAFNALIDNGAAGALPELAKKMGMTQDKMVELGSKGKISADKFGKALIELNEKGGEKMAATSKMAKDSTAGIATAIAVAKSAVTRSVAHIIQEIGPNLVTAFQGIKAKLNEMKPMFQAFGKAIAKSFSIAGDVAKFLTPFAKAVAPMAGIFLGASAGALAFSKSMGALRSGLDMVTKHPWLTAIFTIGSMLVYAYQNNEKFRKGVNDLGQSILEITQNAGKWIEGLKSMDKGAIGAIAANAAMIVGIFGMAGGFKLLGRVIGGTGSAFKKLGSFLNPRKLFGFKKGAEQASKASDALGKSTTKAAKGTGAMSRGFGSLMKLAGVALVIASIALLARAIEPLAKTGGDGAIAMLAFGASVGIMAAVLGTMGTKLTAGLGGILAFGAAVSVMALAMTPIAQAGSEGAIGVAVFALSIGALAGMMALLGPMLTIAAPGMLAFGAAIFLVGTGIGIAAAGIALFAMQLPIVATYGLQSALAFLALGGALLVFGVGSLVAGVGLGILSVGLLMVGMGALVASAGIMMLTVTSMMLSVSLMLVGASSMLAAVGMMMAGASAMLLFVGMMMVVVPTLILSVTLPLLAASLLLVGAGALVASAGMIVFGAGAVVAAAGTVALLAALTLVNTQMNSIAKNAANSAASLKEMVTAIDIVKAGLDTIGSAAKDAVGGLLSAFSSAIAPAKSNGTQLGTAASMGVTAGLTMGTPMAMAAMTRLVSSIRSVGMRAVGTMRSIGMMIGQGLAVGMNSALGAVTAAANRLVGEAERAARAKAKIHSPSRLMRDQVGRYIGEGMAVGMDNEAGTVTKSANGLVNAAVGNVSGVAPSTSGSVPSSNLSGAIGGTINNSSTQSSGDDVNINFGQGAITIQAAEGESGESLLEKFETAMRAKYEAGLAH